jgi:beta-lactam-binding protein with PASTA domain
MKTILIIVLILALVAGAVYVGTKFFGLTKDEDKDGIPDIVEDKVADAKSAVKKTTKEVKRRARRVKEELKDVADAAKDVVDQAGDVAGAVKGKPRAGRKPRRKSNVKK